MNIQVSKSMGGTAHDFRHEPEFSHMQRAPNIHEKDTHKNEVIYDDRELLRQVATMTHQPDTGRKIRSDANRFVTVIFTLPEELKQQRLDDHGEPMHIMVPACDRHGQPKLDTTGKPLLRASIRYEATSPDTLQQWQESTMEFVDQHMPGRLVYAVQHMDEENPHIHVCLTPMDEKGHLSHKKHYPPGRECFRNLQAKYSEKLAPLGVVENSREVKDARALEYVKTTSELKVKTRGVVEQVREAERTQTDLMASNIKEMPEEMPEQKRRESRKNHLARLRTHFRNMRITILNQAAKIQTLTRRLEKALTQRTLLTKQLNQVVSILLQKVPEQERLKVSRELDDAGIDASPSREVILEHYRAQRQEREKEQDLGL